MQVGEIIFHYATGGTIAVFYMNEAQRERLISEHRNALHYDIIPYEGSGMPNYLNTNNKTYKTALAQGTNDYYNYAKRKNVIHKKGGAMK